MLRLDKFLADMGLGTRNEVKKILKKGLVTVNGEIVKNPATKVNEFEDEVEFDTIPIVYQKHVYFMLNKPAGYVSATRDDSLTVLDLLMEPYKGMFPCGRLDKDTTGLLLITNDGQLSHQLLSPTHHVEKEYIVESKKPLTNEDVALFESGITIDGNEKVKPAKVINLDGCSCHLIIREGKYHQIKRMFEAVDNEVTSLKRIRMKNLTLDESLAPGEYRSLTDDELNDLKECDE